MIGNILPFWMNRMRDNGIYVIIDFPAHNKYLEEAKGIIAAMTTKYGDHPNLIYEIWNEPDYFGL